MKHKHKKSFYISFICFAIGIILMFTFNYTIEKRLRNKYRFIPHGEKQDISFDIRYGLYAPFLALGFFALLDFLEFFDLLPKKTFKSIKSYINYKAKEGKRITKEYLKKP